MLYAPLVRAGEFPISRFHPQPLLELQLSRAVCRTTVWGGAKERTDEWVGRWRPQVDLPELERWRLYMLVPHHYVNQCLLKSFVSRGSTLAAQACTALSALLTLADVCSALGLWCLLASSAPADIARGADSPGGCALPRLGGRSPISLWSSCTQLEWLD